MTDNAILMIIWSFGALILVGSALAAYRLSWKRSITFALIWASFFVVATLLFRMLGMA
ncbi:hypothetical protein [Parerythrobacter lacustris]|uniref:DUF2768 domain-containing protein n=1 Tax=Parerythrobacter lacustris TaxID=2969984 RepID=A0ABT1XQ73_9SPHN|nr:hypothetical protein [Parerythrobacter lacustris]MCR2833809.1 hypothetical protein [Parerythrobacter lacustris]